MSKAIAICRVSTKNQEENNHSLEQQGSSVMAMAATLEVPIVKTWSMAVSSKKGNNLKRKDLKEAVNYCRYNKSVKFILLDKVSRLAREMPMVFYYKVLFSTMGVKLLFCDPKQQKYNEDTAESNYELARKAYDAEAENEERSQTSTTKMKARVALGYYPFYPHQGYTKTALEDGLHVPDQPRYDLLRTALKSLAAFEMTVEEAVRWLYVNGYRTPVIFRKNKAGIRIQTGNRKLDNDHFRSIAIDSYYAGILEVGDWPVNEHGLHKPMITVEEWEMNVAIIKYRKKRTKLQFNPHFRMNKALHFPCQHNVGKITGIDHSNGKGWRRDEYLCRACRKRVPRALVHASVDDILLRTKPSKEAVKDLVAALGKTWKNNEAYRIEHNRELNLRKISLNQKKSDLIITLSMNPDIAEDIKPEIERTKAEIAEADRQLAETNSVDEDYREFMSYALDYTENLRDRWWKLPANNFLECKQLLFNDEILVAQDGKVYTPNISPIYTLMEAKSSPKAANNANMEELAGTAPASVSLFG